MKRRTFISMMSVMAAAGVLTLSGCSNRRKRRCILCCRFLC